MDPPLFWLGVHAMPDSIGTARFRLHAPGEAVRTYMFTCSKACAQRTLQRMMRGMVAGAIVDMEWWDADGVPVAGGSLGRMTSGAFQLMPPMRSTHRIRMQPKPAPDSVRAVVAARTDPVTDTLETLYKRFLSPLVVHHES